MSGATLLTVLASTLVVGGAAPSSAAVVDPPATGTLLLDESLQAGVGEPWVALDSACLTGPDVEPQAEFSIPYCEQSFFTPYVGDSPGFLQLTDASPYDTGSVMLDRAVSGAGGIVAQFEQWQYGGSGGGNIEFVLSDGAAAIPERNMYYDYPDYARVDGTDGVPSGYLGVALDQTGTFSSSENRRGAGCAPGTSGPGVIPNSVTLRGPGNGLRGYCWLAGSVVPSTLTSTMPSRLHATDSSAASGRTVRVTVSPETEPLVTVELDLHDGAGFVTAVEHRMETAAPESWRLGFIGVSDGGSDIRLIRDLEVRSIEPLAQLSVTASVQPVDGGNTVGETVHLRYLLTNTSNFPLSNVSVADDVGSGIYCPRSSLGTGTAEAVMTCDAYTTVTREQAAFASFDATATTTALSRGSAISGFSTVTVPLSQLSSALTVEASSSFDDTNSNSVADPGESLDVTYAVTNSGGTSLTGVAVTDAAGSAISPASVPSLGPGETLEFALSERAVTQADVDTADLLEFRATATATSPLGESVVSEPDLTEIRLRPAVSDLQLTAVPELIDLDGDNLAGEADSVGYEYTITNSGTTTLRDVAIVDARSESFAPPLVPFLETGATANITGSSSALAFLDLTGSAGLVNSGTATGNDLRGAVATSEVARATVPTRVDQASITLTPSLSLIDANDNGAADAGDDVQSSFHVRNSGSTPLQSVQVTDVASNAVLASIDLLSPGEVAVIAGTTFPVEQSEIDLTEPKSISAVASAVGPNGVMTSSEPESATLTLARPWGGLSLTTEPQPVDSGIPRDGFQISWDYTLTNTGTATLYNVTLTSDRPVTTAAIASLAPGETVTVEGEDDFIDSGELTDGFLTSTATASAETVAIGPVVSEVSTSSIPTGEVFGGISVFSSIRFNNREGYPPAEVGDSVSFLYRVTNDGGINLFDVTVGGSAAPTVIEPAVALAPQSSVTFTSSPITITQADVDEGDIVNLATASGTDAEGEFYGSIGSDSWVRTVDAAPAVALDTVSQLDDMNADGQASAGESISFVYLVTNTGNITLDRVAVIGQLSSPTAALVDRLAPGQTIELAGTDYIIGNSGAGPLNDISSSATVTAVPRRGDVITAQSLTVPTIAPIQAAPTEPDPVTPQPVLPDPTNSDLPSVPSRYPVLALTGSTVGGAGDAALVALLFGAMLVAAGHRGRRKPNGRSHIPNPTGSPAEPRD